jgi:hypothetical protein
MARGWESKSVEEQQAEANSQQANSKARLSSEEIVKQRQREGLTLSRNRVRQQLQSATSSNHRRMLESALSDLETQIAQLG